MDAEAFFDATLAASRRLEGLQRRISAVEEELDSAGQGSPGFGPHGTSGGQPDPVFSGTLRRMAARDRLGSLLRERADCEAQVGDCLAVIRGMAEALGEPTAECMEAHYVDGRPWAEVAESQGVTERTVLRRRSVAVDWLADVGLANARRGLLTRPDDSGAI